MMNACTIIASNYLAHARVLAASFLRWHPDARFTVLVIDDEHRELGEEDESFEMVRPTEIGLQRDELHTMAAIYDAQELSTAVKPWLLECLLGRGESAVIYLDPDIEVFASLEHAETLAKRQSIVLTPHALGPFERREGWPTELDLLRVGTFNLGFIAVGSGAEPFLSWWQGHLRRDCISEIGEGFFVDQCWVDLVPAYFPHCVLRDPSYNVAYWNIIERGLAWTGERFEVNGEPLRFFHFSGFDPTRPAVLSRFRHSGQSLGAEVSDAVARLCTEYADRLLASGYSDWNARGYGFGRATSGLALDRAFRRRYRDALLGEEMTRLGRRPPDPFNSEDADDFANWVGANHERAQSGLDRASNYLRMGPDVSAPTRYGTVARLYRRLVRRALRHYTNHQRQTGKALVDAVREAQDALTMESERVRGEIAELSRRLTACEARVGALGDPLDILSGEPSEDTELGRSRFRK